MALLWISILLLGAVYIGKAEFSNETRVSTSDYFFCPSGRSRDSMTLAENDTISYYTNSYQKYENKVKCMLDIKADNCLLSMTCYDFDIDSKRPNCKGGDYIKINRKRYCRPNNVPMIENAKRLKVLFKSNKKKVAKGAYCEIRGVAKPETETDGCKCGLANRSTRIVGGEETEVNEYPWQAGIVSKDADFVWCGGSVLTTKWIITAAHCTDGTSANSIQVLLGVHDYYDGNPNGKTVRKDVIQIEEHSNYDSFTTDYDFSLLKLSSPIDFEANSHIRPICLPQNDANQYTDYMATVTGWGTTQAGGSTSNVLREVDVKILTNEVCKNRYSSITITQQMICAAEANGNGGKDSCQGDSGGPLVTKEPGHSGTVAGQNYELIGVVSWGRGCALKDYPGVYARVTEQLDWIKSITSPTAETTCPRT